MLFVCQTCNIAFSKFADYLSNMSTAKLLYSHPFFSGKTGVPLEKVSLIPCLGSKLLKNYQIPPKNSAKLPVKQTLNNEFGLCARVPRARAAAPGETLSWNIFITSGFRWSQPAAFRCSSRGCGLFVKWVKCL